MVVPEKGKARTSAHKPVRERLAEVAAEATGTDEFVHGLLAFLAELAEREPAHPILSTLVEDMGRQSAEAVSAGLMHDVGNLLQIASAQLDVMRLDLNAVFDPSRLDPGRRVEMFTRFVDGLSAAREAARSAGALSSRGVDVYARRDEHADVREVLGTAVDLGRRLVARRAELSLENRADGEIAAARSDVLRVLVNLIRNAADAVGTEIGGMVMVEAWQSPEQVFLSVADNGPGIAPGEIDSVFDLFYTTKGHGTGVGLFVCNMLVRGWGGELHVESQRGKGARFTASVPRAPASLTE